MHINCLFEEPKLSSKASLFIEPLAPLSLVTSMPGAYYRSQREPSQFMVYGMLENLLGWHFTDYERNPIIKDLKKHHKKKHKLDLKFNKTPVGFRPLLQYHLQIEKLLLKPHIDSYEDYWTQHLKDVDERHAKGTRNYDCSLEADANKIYTFPRENRDRAWRELFEYKTHLFPMYYQSPTKREYIIVLGRFGYPIISTKTIIDLIIEANNNLESPLYLGTNEGWVHLEIEKI
jgi:CRISPR-associated protein Cas5